MMMMMMLFLLSFMILTLASAEVFSISAFAPNTKVNGTVLHASSSGFYSGLKGPSTYCPLSPSSCPKVAGTLVTSDMGSMAVMVPGGQQIYVQSDGQVRYTSPHSADIPAGSIIGGWYTKTIYSDCKAQRSVLGFSDGKGHDGVFLCPNQDSPRIPGDDVLYVKTEDFKQSDCIDVVGLALTRSDANVGCWEYA